MNALRVLLVCAGALATAGCGGEGPTTPAPSEHPYDGNWAGKLSDGEDVLFKIENSRITSFETIVRVPSRCGFFLDAQPHTPINGQEFTFQAGEFFMNSTTVSGRFESHRRMTGTLGATSVTTRLCNVEPPVAIAARTFWVEQ